jgi:hypothetical protein
LNDFKFTEANDDESLRGNKESLSKIVKYNNHYGEDMKVAADTEEIF